jgi:calmodulin
MPLTEDQEHEMMDIFAKYSSGGSIGSNEIGKASRAGGLNPTEADLASWKAEVKSGLNQGAFIKFMNQKFGECNDSTDEIVDAFQAFDATGNGTITVAELKHILTTMGEKMTAEEVQMLVNECDVDDGRINYIALAGMLYNPNTSE